MKKLILYSDQVAGKSDTVDAALLGLIHQTDPRIAYIPSRGDVTRKYYNQTRGYYGGLGINELLYFDIDIEFDPSAIDDLLSCDAIHLSGGDTAYFLHCLKERGSSISCGSMSKKAAS